VQEGASSYRAGLVIKGPVDIDNPLHLPRLPRGGHHLRALGRRGAAPSGTHEGADPGQRHRHAAACAPWRQTGRARAGAPPGPKLKRAANGERLEISVILPPTFAAGIERGKVMVTFEGKWSRGRVPLSALPMNQAFALSPEDTRLLDKAEELAGNETPGGLMLNLVELTQLLDALAGHPRVALGRNPPLVVSATAWRVPVEATLETSGESG